MADDPAEQLLKAGVAWLGIILGLLALGVAVSGTLAAATAGLLIVVAVASTRIGEVSVPFGVSLVAVVVVLVEYVLPEAIASRLPDVGALIGFPTGQFDALKLFITAMLAILLIWIVQIRVSGRAVKPTTITKRVRTKFEKLVDTYVTMARLVAGFGLTAIFLVFRESGQLAGEAGATLGDVPFVTSSFASAISGFLALGGELPVVGGWDFLNGISPGAWAVLMLITIGLAAGVKYND